MKSTPISAIVLFLALSALTAFAGRVTVTNVTASQRQAGDARYEVEWGQSNGVRRAFTTYNDSFATSLLKCLARRGRCLARFILREPANGVGR